MRPRFKTQPLVIRVAVGMVILNEPKESFELGKRRAAFELSYKKLHSAGRTKVSANDLRISMSIAEQIKSFRQEKCCS